MFSPRDISTIFNWFRVYSVWIPTPHGAPDWDRLQHPSSSVHMSFESFYELPQFVDTTFEPFRILRNSGKCYFIDLLTFNFIFTARNSRFFLLYLFIRSRVHYGKINRIGFSIAHKWKRRKCNFSRLPFNAFIMNAIYDFEEILKHK